MPWRGASEAESFSAGFSPPLFRAAPYVQFACMALVASIVPVLATDLPFSAAADVIALVGLFALARLFAALAAMDVGTAFGSMGARREVLVACLAENARIPVDNPDTSASPSSASACCAWKSGWVTRTRASRSASKASPWNKVPAWRAGSAATPPSPTPGPTRWRRKALRDRARPRGRSGSVMLERERIANHLADLGALGNDAGFALGLAQFASLREQLLRANGDLFGHRYLMDAIIPGGVGRDLDQAGAERMRTELAMLEQAVARLHGIYDDHAGLQDRFMGAGRIVPALAAQLGLTGLAGRASGQTADLRKDFPAFPYDRLDVPVATHGNGDVAARAAVRFDEIFESIRLCASILERMPGGPVASALPPANRNSSTPARWKA